MYHQEPKFMVATMLCYLTIYNKELQLCMYMISVAEWIVRFEWWSGKDKRS